LPEGKYDFIVAQRSVAGESPNALDEKVSGLLQQALQSAFGLSGKKEAREVEVMLLKVKEANARGLVVSPTELGASSVGPGVVEGSLANVVMALDAALNKPVIDETGLTNRYEIVLHWAQKAWDKSNPEGLLQVVREQLGLEVVPAKRPMEVVIIEPGKTSASAKSREGEH
jgi:uncharacterized protein (TIGR03435 family)